VVESLEAFKHRIDRYEWSRCVQCANGQFKHTVKGGRVTVSGKPSDDLAPGTLNSIVKQSGLKK
jgi:hypothetical protein